MTRKTIALGCTEVALIAAAVTATVPSYGSLFATNGYLTSLLPMAWAGVLAASLAGALRRWISALTLGYGVAGFLITARLVMSWRSMPFSDVGSGLVNGWVRTITFAHPLGTEAQYLLTPGLMLYAAGFVAVTLALRTRALLAPVTLLPLPLMAALLLTAGDCRAAVPCAVAVLSLALGLVLVRVARLVDVAAGVRSASQANFGLPMAAVVVAVAIGATLLFPAGKNHFDPQTLLPAPPADPQSVTPLALVRSQLQAPRPRTLFTVRVSGAPLDRVRTAALDDYDGALWTSHDRFRMAGRTLAPQPGLRPRATVDLDVHITALDQRYLPAAGWPQEVEGGQVKFSAESGVLTAPTDTPTGLHYHLVAGVQPADAVTRAAKQSPLPEGDPALPPMVPAELIDTAKLLTQGAPDPLEALQSGLRRMPYAIGAAPGQSLGRLAELLSPGGSGYVEQYAAAFAVMARALGFRVRVVTGYLLRPSALSGGVYTVRTSDAWAWDEVYRAGYGWMTFDPTNPLNRQRPAPARHNPTSPVPAAVPKPPLCAVQAHQQQPRSGTGHSAWPKAALLTLAVVLGITVLVPPLVVTEKWRRHRRRRRGSPAERIAGAWRQSTDRLRQAGLPTQRAWTALETAEHARTRFGVAAAPVAVLASLVGTAFYGTRQPDLETSVEAWEADRALRTALRRQRGPVATACAWLDPRPLLPATAASPQGQVR